LQHRFVILGVSELNARSVFLVALTLIAGCGAPGIDVKLAPVTGAVTKDGKPLTDVKVILESKDPASKAPMLFGLTNAEGKYEIQTSSGEKGAPAGLYKVYLAETKAPAEFDYSSANKGGGPPKSTSLIPANYQSPATTELSVDVTATGATYDILIK
jgi:hypothetical protein